MDAGSRSINDILNGSRRLEIPFFQRSYVWEEPLWQRFLESMREVSTSGDTYFLGTLILKQSSTSSGSGIGDIRTVIDGQQRLTTLLLFLKVLCTRNNQLEEFTRISKVRGQLSLLHNCFDRPCFEEIIHQENLCPVNFDTRLSNAYNYFLENVNTSDFDLFKILDNIVFVGIDLLPNENEQIIFDTINSLGVSLTTGELLKNYIFSEETFDKYNSIWKPVFEADEDTIKYWNDKTTLGRLQRINLETFLYAYLHIKINDPTLNLSTADKACFRSAEDLFNQYKLYLHLSNIDLIDFARDLTNYAKLYREYINSDILDEELPREWGIERLNALIFGLDTTTMIPYVLYVLKNQSDGAEIKCIAKVLEAYVMRRIICKSGNDNYSDLFSLNLISNQILTSEDLIDYLVRKQSDSSLAVPNDDALHGGIMESVLTNPRAKGVLYFLESKIRDEYQSTTLKSFNSYSLEHLLPKKWNPSVWPLILGFDAEDRNQRLKTLGNLSILPIKLNTSISNKSWDIKKNGNGQRKGLLHYASGIETLSRWLTYPIWDENKINERAEWLFNSASRVWQFGPQYHQSPSTILFGDDFSNSFNQISNDNSFSATPSPTSETIDSDVSEDSNGRDRTKYTLCNSGLLSKRDFVFYVIQKFVSENPNVSFDELKTVFPDSIMEQRFRRKGLIASVDTLLDGDMTEEQLNTRYYFNRNDRCLKIGNTEFFVNNQHTRISADNILSKALELGYEVSSTDSSSSEFSATRAITTSNSSHKAESTRLRITLPNGNVIEKPNAIDSLTNYILQIGVDRVVALGISCYNDYPFLTTSFISHKLQKKIGGRYYLFKNSSTITKKQQIEEINQLLNLNGVVIDLIPKSQPIV